MLSLLLIFSVLYLLNQVFFKFKYELLFIVFFTFFILNAFQSYNVGVDLYRYQATFVNVESVNSFSSFVNYYKNIGYTAVSYIVFHTFGSFEVLLFIYSLFVNISLYKFIKKYSVNFGLSILILIGLNIFDFSFSAISQMTSMCILLYSFDFVVKKDLSKFIVIVIFASVFHNTAPIFIFFYFLYNISSNKYIIYIVTLIPILTSIFLNPLYVLTHKFIYDEKSDLIMQRYQETGIGGILIMLVLISILIFAMYHITAEVSKKNQLVSLYSVTMLMVAIQIFATKSYLYTRLNLFYLIFLIIFIPQIIFLIKKTLLVKSQAKLLSIVTLTIFYFIFFYLSIGETRNSAHLPYYEFRVVEYLK